MTLKGKFIVLGFGTPLAALVLIGLVKARTDPSPLRVGSKADEAWSYVRTGVVFEATSKPPLAIRKKAHWYADVRGIHAETKFYFRSKYPFATRRIVYAMDTNSTIRAVGISWKPEKPF